MSRGPGDARTSCSRIARSTADRVEVRGFNLTEDLVGKVDPWRWPSES